MHKGTILVVDDEELLLQVLDRKLTAAGYYVSKARSGEQALKILQDYCHDLLLTDYVMDGMTGGTLIEQAKAKYPQIKVIMMSGWADEGITAEMPGCGPDDFFHKPIAFNLLLKRIEELLK